MFDFYKLQKLFMRTITNKQLYHIKGVILILNCIKIISVLNLSYII